MTRTKNKPTKRPSKVDDAATFGVILEDGRRLTCDLTWPLKPGREVVVLYPARKGEPRRASGIGTLESQSPKKTGVVWVSFPMEGGGERRTRIDQDEGYVVARVAGIFTPLPVRDDPRLARRAS